MAKLKSKTATKHDGFMLLEVLIALFIVGLILVAMIKATTDNARTLIILKNKTIAQWVAQNVFHDAELGIISPKTAQGNIVTGITPMAGQKWAWKIKFTPLPEPHAWQTNIEVKPQSFQSQSIIYWTGYLS